MNTTKYGIKAEPYNWTVFERRTAGADAKEPGKVYETGVSYHANLLQAATSLHDRLIREKMPNDEASVYEIKCAINEATREIETIVREVQL